MSSVPTLGAEPDRRGSQPIERDSEASLSAPVRDAIERVTRSIPDSATRSLAGEVLRLSLGSLQQLTDVDDAIYDLMLEAGASRVTTGEAPIAIEASVLKDAHQQIFRGVHELANFISKNRLTGRTSRVSEDPGWGFDEGDFDFDVDSIPPEQRSRKDFATIDEGDIDQAFGFLREDEVSDSKAKAERFRTEMAPLTSVFSEQLESHDARFHAAVSRGNAELALRELDGSREPFAEALFAIGMTVFQVFVGHVERAELLPTYRSAVEQALLLRSGLADLMRIVTGENECVIQDPESDLDSVDEGLDRVAMDLEIFTRGKAFRAMRATDRFELVSFHRRLRRRPLSEAKLAAEGLAKYLESLTIVSQREVVLEHDRELIAELRQSLHAARSLLAISFEGSVEIVRETLRRAHSLYGRSIALDEQIAAWQLSPETMDTAEGVDGVIARLAEMLR